MDPQDAVHVIFGCPCEAGEVVLDIDGIGEVVLSTVGEIVETDVTAACANCTNATLRAELDFYQANCQNLAITVVLSVVCDNVQIWNETIGDLNDCLTGDSRTFNLPTGGDPDCPLDITLTTRVGATYPNEGCCVEVVSVEPPQVVCAVLETGIINGIGTGTLINHITQEIIAQEVQILDNKCSSIYCPGEKVWVWWLCDGRFVGETNPDPRLRAYVIGHSGSRTGVCHFKL